MYLNHFKNTNITVNVNKVYEMVMIYTCILSTVPYNHNNYTETDLHQTSQMQRRKKRTSDN